MGTEERRTRLRDELIRLAEAAVAERGLAGLKARDLAQGAGCAVGAIYTVFPDLDALILEVNARTIRAFEAFIADRGEGGGPPAEERLVALATRYLDFAAGHGLRWRALFQHRLSGERPTPDWYMAEQVRLFSYIEEPLGELRPELGPRDRALLARTLFSAVHGIVSLGLDEKLVAVPVPALRRQVETVVAALGAGLKGR
jgi:AcrR family transcriptional regulator